MEVYCFTGIDISAFKRKGNSTMDMIEYFIARSLYDTYKEKGCIGCLGKLFKIALLFLGGIIVLGFLYALLDR